MSFSYESGSSYLRVKLQDYKITQSLKRDEQTMSLTLKADYNLDIPGRGNCDYDDTWNYSCTDASGTHISGYSMAKTEYSRF